MSHSHRMGRGRWGWLLFALWPAVAGNGAAAEPFADARQLLRRFQLDERHWQGLEDGRSVRPAEMPALLRCLARVDTLPPAEVERLARTNVNPTALRDAGLALRGQIYRLVGQVTGVTPVQPPPALARQFGVDEYYCCEMKLQGNGAPALLYTRNVPEAWRSEDSVEQRGGALGIYLKCSSGDPAWPTPVFVAPHLAWYPRTVLGDLGVDAAALAAVKSNRPLAAGEGEAFYQILAAAARSDAAGLYARAQAELQGAQRRAVSMTALFNQPDGQVGRLLVLEGTARSVVEVPVEDPTAAARLGAARYYQITLFTYGTPAEPDADSQDNPLVVCVRDLPPGLPLGDYPAYAEPLRVAGFYFKKWAYPLPRSVGKPVWQLAPLLVGTRPQRLPGAAQSARPAAQASLALLVGLGAMIAVWRMGRH